VFAVVELPTLPLEGGGRWGKKKEKEPLVVLNRGVNAGSFLLRLGKEEKKSGFSSSSPGMEDARMHAGQTSRLP